MAEYQQVGQGDVPHVYPAEVLGVYITPDGRFMLRFGTGAGVLTLAVDADSAKLLTRFIPLCSQMYQAKARVN